MKSTTSQRKTLRLGFLAVMAMTLVASACSSSGGGTASAGTASATSAAGSPIKLGIIVPVGTPAVNDIAAVSAARGAARAINASGGVDGHPLSIVFCNSDLNPNQDHACALQMINDHVAATVGNAIYTTEAESDLLFRKAGIAQIGNWASGVSESDPNSYLLWGGQNYDNAAQVYGGLKWVGTKVGLVRLAFPYTAAYFTWYDKAIPAQGGQIVSTTVTPSNTVSDYAPYAAQLVKGDPQVVLPDLGYTIVPLTQAMDELGWNGKVVMQDTNFTPQEYGALSPKLQSQIITTSPFPPPFASSKFAGVKEFLRDMEAEKAAGDSNAPTGGYSTTTTWDAYLAVRVFAEVAGPAHAFDAASFKKAIDSAKNISLLGLAPPWNPSEVGFAKLPRANQDSWYFYTYVDGKGTLLNTTPVAVISIVEAGF